MQKKYTIAFDMSSKCCGFAFGMGGQVMKYGKWVNKKYDNGNKDHGKSLLKFSSWLSRTLRNCERPPQVVIFEAPFKGRNVVTYGVLSKFLGVAEREVRRLLPDVQIVMVSPHGPKVLLGVRKGKTHADRKIAMVKKINSLLGLNLKFHPRDKSKSDDDIADAIALLLYWFEKEDA